MSEIPEPVTAAPPPPAEAADVFGDQLPLARRYADLLATTGISHGLVGPRETPRLWERHLVNCAVMESLLPVGSGIIDIGSGAGLPGIALAVARPDLRVHLVEPLLRRTTWLEGAVDTLGLGDRVSVHRGRADEVSLAAPVVTARAVASLDRLVRWSFPLLEPGGRLLALKGEAAQRELDEAWPLLRELGVTAATVHVVGEGRVSEPVRVVEIVRPADPPRGGGRKGRGRSAVGTGAPRRPGGRRARRGS
ncbi:16S rRNA (guanine(527)-N(7))-methyltransferase RsmG [Ornithinimicrobium cerasi]|uniref:Ribosomal RNA small subunit methyltransferase G n=1 Tax=Ornithinimicrobium cerasi TaxID=2248773 RepID=A0A285VYD2_9MICO|nr:16S rRNA (guanine(527)-N(7))-methyltransferase RsmG [Ornithinimicrobium cerasi]SOC58266.1 16S rRNA m(7)G-527 methyltransferase [Ornithinimicrobium cerasi]